MTSSARVGIVCAILVSLLLNARVLAVTTRMFLLDSASALEEGKLEGTAVESSGAVVVGVETQRYELENVGTARSVLVLKDGTTFVGTGNDGKVWKLRGGKVSEHASTGELLVSALATDGRGTLFAGTLPHGKIFAIDRAGKVRLLSQPKDAEHIWSLVYDTRRRTLFAATGPQGKVFAIDARGRSEVYYDSDADHVMALAQGEGGTLYAGTSDEAQVLRLDGPGKAEVVYDFEGNEITALSFYRGKLAVAANLFPKKKKTKKKKKTTGKQTSKDADSDQTGDKPTTDKPKPGKGDLWTIDSVGRARKLFSSDKGHITAVQWVGEGELFAATGKEGHVYRVHPDGTHSLWIDVDERQVLALDFAAKTPTFVTGDAAAIYTVAPGPAAKARWESKVLDARFRSRWGQLTWRGRGKLSFQTRSGNTEKPDDSWSEWSSALRKPAPVRSPAGRFLQVRADLAGDPDTAIYAVQAYYLPRNQPVTLSDVSAQVKKKKKGKKSDDRAEQPSTVYELSWKPDNPDGDELRYRLHYRPEGARAWRAILKESDVLTETKHEWETQSIPDGFYRIRVQATDELDNPEHAVLEAEGLSEPFRVDNHPPHLDGLRVANGKVTGVARDEFGPISALEFAIDGEPFRPFYPKDDLFDTREEAFELALPKLEPGVHVVAIRTRDARNNSATEQLEVTR